MATALDSPLLSLEAVLAIAEADAIAAYGDLSHLKARTLLQDGKWHIEYRLNYPPGMKVAGGGPHYVISAETGEILSKKYYQ